MHDLEDDAKRMLDPWIHRRYGLLTADDQELLALWVAKTAMTYSMWYPRIHRPFDANAFRWVYQHRAPPEQSLIWIAFSDASTAQIAMSLRPDTLEVPTVPQGDHSANTAAIYLAANGVVFFYHYWRGPAGLREVFGIPPELRPGVQQLWPPRAAVRGPLRLITDDQLAGLVGYIPELLEHIGLPLLGLTPEELRTVSVRFLRGDDPSDLRREFENRQ